jgi:hypothetical protein
VPSGSAGRKLGSVQPIVGYCRLVSTGAPPEAARVTALEVAVVVDPRNLGLWFARDPAVGVRKQEQQNDVVEQGFERLGLARGDLL